MADSSIDLGFWYYFYDIGFRSIFGFIIQWINGNASSGLWDFDDFIVGSTWSRFRFPLTLIFACILNYERNIFPTNFLPISLCRSKIKYSNEIKNLISSFRIFFSLSTNIKVIFQTFCCKIKKNPSQRDERKLAK